MTSEWSSFNFQFSPVTREPSDRLWSSRSSVALKNVETQTPKACPPSVPYPGRGPKVTTQLRDSSLSTISLRWVLNPLLVRPRRVSTGVRHKRLVRPSTSGCIPKEIRLAGSIRLPEHTHREISGGISTRWMECPRPDPRDPSRDRRGVTSVSRRERVLRDVRSTSQGIQWCFSVSESPYSLGAGTPVRSGGRSLHVPGLGGT